MLPGLWAVTMLADNDFGGIIQLVVVVAFVVIGLIIKGLGKLFESAGKKQEKDAKPGGGASPPPAGETRRPEEALEQFFEEAKQKKRQQQAVPPARARNLDDFFNQMVGGGPAPAQRPQAPKGRAVPVARAVSVAGKPRGKAGALRSAEPVAAGAVDLRYSTEAVDKAKAAISRARKRKGRKLRVVRAVKEPRAESVSTGALGKIGRAELMRGVVYSELLGKPRAIEPYSGPPAAK